MPLRLAVRGNKIGLTILWQAVDPRNLFFKIALASIWATIVLDT
jgi:hypothetical protein